LRKLLAAPVIALGVVALSATSAFARECFNSRRSTEGNEGASRSNAWFTLTLDDLFGDAVTKSAEFGLLSRPRGR
jgi:hypothetical protein